MRHRLPPGSKIKQWVCVYVLYVYIGTIVAGTYMLLNLLLLLLLMLLHHSSLIFLFFLFIVLVIFRCHLALGPLCVVVCVCIRPAVQHERRPVHHPVPCINHAIHCVLYGCRCIAVPG